MWNIRAGSLNVSTFFGDVDLGDVWANRVDIDANGNVAGTYEVADTLDIHSTLGIGTAAEDLSTPLIISAGSTATAINLAGEYGVNVRVPGQATLTFAGLQTAMRGEGTIIDGDGTVLATLQDLVAPGEPPLTSEQLLGVGILLDASQSTVTVAGTGILSDGAPVEIDSRTYVQTADLQSGGGDVSILGRNGAFSIQLQGDIRSSGGDIVLETRNSASVVMAATAEIDAGAGSIVIDSAGSLTLGHLLSSGTGGTTAPTFSITAGGTVAALGNGAAIRGTSPTSFLSLDAGALANAGPSGFITDVGGLSVSVDAGDIHVRNISDLSLATAANNGGGVIDLFVQGNLDLDGVVSSEAGNGTRGDVVLTATGSITGALSTLVADEVFLNALAGGIGASPLIIDHPAVRRYEVFGWRDVELQIDGPFGAGHLISATGSVKVTAGPVEIGVVGALTKATIVSASAIVGRYGSPNPVVTLPAVPDLVLPQSYLDAIALVPGEQPPLPPADPDDPDQPEVPVVPGGDGIDLDRLRELRRHIGRIDVVPPSALASVIRALSRAVASGRISIDIGAGLPGGGPADSDDDDEDGEPDED
jgi:hypothetical protein